MMLKGDCINKVRKSKCKKLIVDICLGEKCSFKQTKTQEKESRKLAFDRLAKLDGAQQLYIADKYYGGDMPWQKGGRRL